ncbi:MAG: UDP-glucose 4-epimerase [Paraglaciecola sp.]|jgi:UDP-glucose 4-epimerase
MQQRERSCFKSQTIRSNSIILVIGGSGDVGFRVVEQALALGAKAVIMDLSNNGALREISKLTNFVSIDLRDTDSIFEAFSALNTLQVKFDSVKNSSR